MNPPEDTRPSPPRESNPSIAERSHIHNKTMIKPLRMETTISLFHRRLAWWSRPLLSKCLSSFSSVRDGLPMKTIGDVRSYSSFKCSSSAPLRKQKNFSARARSIFEKKEVNPPTILLPQRRSLATLHSGSTDGTKEQTKRNSQAQFSSPPETDDGPYSHSRAMTARERITTFPKGVSNLYLDVRRYFDITACAQSNSPNSWKGRIPRRQRQQQRQLRDGIMVVGPLVALWIPPIM